MSSVSLSIGAVIYAVFLLIICIIKKVNLLRIENKVYFALIITSIVGLVLDCISFFLTFSMQSLNNPIYEGITKLMLCYYDIWCFVFLLYIIAVLLRKQNKLNLYGKYKKILFFFILPFLLLVNLLCPIQYVVENHVIFPQGISVMLCYATAFIAVIIMIILLLKNKKYIFDKEFIPLWLLVILSSVVIAVQFIFPGLILITAMEAFDTFIMYFTIENPDIKMIEQLNLAKDIAEKANHAKSDFLSSMSHEIRTPLNAIVGLSEDIKDHKGLPKDVEDEAKDIVAASHTLLEIVGNILDINKIESEKMEIIEVPYHFKEEILELAKIAGTRIGEKPIDYQIHIAEDVPYELLGDRVHIKQIVNNLLTNAIKYTEQGTITLHVKCINQNNTSLLIITCQDTGRGIKAENIEKLFTKFERLGVEKTSTAEGTGLGLAITKKLVEMMGGTINVQSQYGKGSIFMVQVPQKISKLVNPNPNEEDEDIELLKVDDPYSGKRVLIVDDNKLNLKVAKVALKDFNFMLEECTSGTMCLEKIKAGNQYDLILMDIMMPEMSGETTLSELQKIEGFHTPVIALTADAIQGAQEKYLQEGFTDYVSKPFTKEIIKEKIDRIILPRKGK